jgi:AraC-like DNA-binding protein/mannose-6-phosphate isomerase-like protein (cupin superfamily)
MNPNSLFNVHWREGMYQIKVKAYYYQDFKDYITPKNHVHRRIEIMYVVKGECEILMKDISVAMKKGEFILIDADIPHRLKVEENRCRILNIEFFFQKKYCPFFTIGELVRYMPALENFFSIQEHFFVLKDTEERLAQLIRDLIKQLDDLEIGNDFTQQMLMGQIFIRIANIYNQSKKIEKNPQNQYVIHAIDYMHQQYDYKLTVEDIAKEVNLHQRYLQHIFKMQIGCTINEYLTKIRLNKAKQLLKYTDIHITQICEYIGMNSQQYFSYLFKKHVGVSPRAYRKEKIKLETNET